MSSLLHQSLPLASSRTPLIQFLRYRGKINIQRPRQPHYDRALVNAVTQPIYKEPPKALTCFQRREERSKVQLDNPYNTIIAREVRNWLEHSRMVAIFHLNSISEDEMFRARVNLHKENMHLKSYGRKIFSMAVSDTRYEAILPLFDSNHCVVFSPEPRVASLLRVTKRVPQMVLLGGIVENKLLSRNELVTFAQMPNIQSAQAELVQTLNMAASNLVQQLQAHQRNLVNVLDVHAKGEVAKEEPNNTEKSETNT